MKRPVTAALAALAAVLALSPALAATSGRRAKPRRVVAPPALVWHVETLDGTVLESKDSDRAINPASVVKVATTWWALERLGPAHRFVTRFEAKGKLDARTGTLTGDLVVRGAGDPDFQSENAFLVATALRDAGIRTITGSVIVDGSFWMGWENGSAGRRTDPAARGMLMASRLRGALDAKRWSKYQRSAWFTWAAKHGRSGVPASITIRGGAHYQAKPAAGTQLLFEYVSRPLVETLRRFNCFSNNDIERVAASIGSASELSVVLADKLAPGGTTPVTIATASGLGQNRLTPRQIVGLLRTLRASAQEKGLTVEGLLPVAGCDPGTVTASFPRLSYGAPATALVAKTGTLTSTDGGVTVLAGFLNTSAGEIVFCVASPRAGGRIRQARRTEETFLLELLGKHGGAAKRTCAPPLPASDDGCSILGPAAAGGGVGGSTAR